MGFRAFCFSKRLSEIKPIAPWVLLKIPPLSALWTPPLRQPESTTPPVQSLQSSKDHESDFFRNLSWTEKSKKAKAGKKNGSLPTFPIKKINKSVCSTLYQWSNPAKVEPILKNGHGWTPPRGRFLIICEIPSLPKRIPSFILCIFESPLLRHVKPKHKKCLGFLFWETICVQLWPQEIPVGRSASLSWLSPPPLDVCVFKRLMGWPAFGPKAMRCATLAAWAGRWI